MIRPLKGPQVIGEYLLEGILALKVVDRLIAAIQRVNLSWVLFRVIANHKTTIVLEFWQQQNWL